MLKLLPPFNDLGEDLTMRRVLGIAVAAVALVSASASAQDDASKAVKDGGIKVAGWQGKVDAREATAGLALKDQLFATMGPGFHVTTGPATTYWNTASNLSGNYTVSASFSEAKQTMNHPHPYGIMIGGKNLDTDKPEALYCAAYRNGTFIFRGFSGTAARGTFQLNGPRGEAHAAVNKVEGMETPVKQEVSITVSGDNVSCSINGQVVSTKPKSEVIGDGKMTSLDGFAGVRFAHNTDAHVSGWAVKK
jgi:hypothetical protein